MSTTMPKHIFVLMLENRSFDHMLGFSGLSGTDAATGSHTTIEGLAGDECNVFGGTEYTVVRGADYAVPADPGHEFPDVLTQLTGVHRYAAPYPPVDNSGFVDAFSHSGGAGANLGEVMRCYDTPRQLPVLYALAQEFAVCDHWFASLPGPTWPNRMFAHAASSAGLDHSPSTAEILEWETVDGFAPPNGTIYEALQAAGRSYHLYSGDEFPIVSALKGIELTDVHRIDDLVAALANANTPFPYDYVFIEPSYDALHDYRNSSCQHPLADVRGGEALLKTVYEAIRNSSVWESSMLVIAWDEHGGFFDHVSPPRAVAPGDTAPGSKYNQYGFTFEQYGVRTPAIVVSPLVPRGTIDHRIYDHASIPKTVEVLFGLGPMTERDANANHLLSLLSLASTGDRPAPPTRLPSPGQAPAVMAAAAPSPLAAIGAGAVPVTRPDASVNRGVLPTFVHAAMRQDLLMRPDQKQAILARVAGLETRADAMAYMQDVQNRLRTGASGVRSALA